MKKSRVKHRISPQPPRVPAEMAALAEGMADDFNNILTTVMGACSLIDRDDSANAELLKSVALIRISAEHAAVLSDKLMQARLPETESSISNPISVRDKKKRDDIVSSNNS